MGIISDGKKMIWNHKFEEGGKEGPRGFQNQDLIKSLKKSIGGFSHEEIGRYNHDNHRHSNYSSRKKLAYKKIRDTADLLGVPPWVLFSDDEENDALSEEYSSIDDPLEEFHISTVGDLIAILDKLATDRGLQKLDSERKEHLFSTLRKLFEKRDFISDTWAEILDHISEGFYEYLESFNWAAHLSITRLMREKYRATIRVKKIFKNNESKGTIRSVWILFTNTEEYPEDDNAEELYIIDQIIKDLCILFKSTDYWKIESDDKRITWYGWHSHRTDSNAPKLLSDTFKWRFDEFKESVNKLHYLQKYILQNDEINKLRKSNSKHLVAEVNEDTRLKPLEYLYTRGYIDEGSLIVLKQYDQKTKVFESNKTKCFAKITIEDKNIKLQWEFDNQLYGLNELNNLINTHLGLSASSHRGSDYWMLVDEGISLYDLALSLQREEANTEQMTIFDEL